jgi:hypothetical protein
MGKKNTSKYDKLGYHRKLEADKRMAGQYGIDVSEYGNQGRPGGGGVQKKSWDDLKQDVASAASNDYDVRRSIEAAQLAGNKKAQKIGSISNASEAYAATRFMEKTHKNRMGNTGAYDGANDQGNVTNYWVNKDRGNLMDSMSAAEQQKEAESGAVAPVSTRLQDDRDTVEELDNKDYNIFDNNIDKGDNETQRTEAADAFLGKFKLDLKKDKQIQPVFPS